MFLKINHFPFSPPVYVFLVTITCSLLIIMALRWLLNLSFCVVSLLWTSRYVLIDISNVTHFLCSNLFVMLYLTQSVNSDLCECSGNSLPITVNYSVQMVDAITIPCNPCHSDFRECSQNSCKLPCGTAFCEDFYRFNPPLWATVWGMVACFSEFWECSQNSRSRLLYTAPLVFFNY